jgi:hypothetical protein
MARPSKPSEQDDALRRRGRNGPAHRRTETRQRAATLRPDSALARHKEHRISGPPSALSPSTIAFGMRTLRRLRSRATSPTV